MAQDVIYSAEGSVCTWVEDHIICKQREFHFFFSYLDSFYFFFCPDCCGQHLQNYLE